MKGQKLQRLSVEVSANLRIGANVITKKLINNTLVLRIFNTPFIKKLFDSFFMFH